MNPQTSEPSVPSVTSSQKAKTGKLPKWLKVVLIILAVVVCLVVVAFVFTSQATKNASKVGSKFVADIQTDNAGAAYGLTAPAFKAASTQATLAALMDRISPALQGKVKIVGRAINKATGQPDQSVLVYTIATKAGTKYIRVVLQENNPWQVYNFRSSDTPLTTSSTS